MSSVDTTAVTNSGPNPQQCEWVVALRRTASPKKEGATAPPQQMIGGDLYAVRLILAADGCDAFDGALLPSPPLRMPIVDVAKLIANSDGVPVVAGRSEDEVMGAIAEAARYASGSMPHLKEVSAHLKEGGERADDLPLLMEPIPIPEVPGLFVVPNFVTPYEEARIVAELMAYDAATSAPNAVVANNDNAKSSTQQQPLPLPDESQRGGDGSVATPWEQLARRDVLHFSRRFFYDSMRVGAVGENVSGPNPLFYEGLVRRLCTGERRPLWGDAGASACGEKRPREPSAPSSSSLAASVSWPVPPDHRCDQLTVNRYRYDKAKKVSSGIAQHVDVHSFFGDIVFSVSLLSHTLLEFERPALVDTSDNANNHENGHSLQQQQQKGQPNAGSTVTTRRVPVFAAPRSLLVMTGEARFLWTHAIQHKYADALHEAAPAVPRRDRVSLTLRKARNDPAAEHNLSNCPYPFMCNAKI